ncbi:MAG: PF20097 family protein [Candidatus Altiarchaeota archaeon]
MAFDSMSCPGCGKGMEQGLIYAVGQDSTIYWEKDDGKGREEFVSAALDKAFRCGKCRLVTFKIPEEE